MNKTVEYIIVDHPSDDNYTFFDENKDSMRYDYNKSFNNMSEFVFLTSVEQLTDDLDCSTITKDEWFRFKNKISLIATSIRASLPEDYRNERLVYMPSADRQHMFMVFPINDTFIVKRFMFSEQAIHNIMPNDPVLEERIDRYFNELLKGMQEFINKLNR